MDEREVDVRIDSSATRRVKSRRPPMMIAALAGRRSLLLPNARDAIASRMPTVRPLGKIEHLALLNPRGRLRIERRTAMAVFSFDRVAVFLKRYLKPSDWCRL
jgi:hypothetical protein